MCGDTIEQWYMNTDLNISSQNRQRVRKKYNGQNRFTHTQQDSQNPALHFFLKSPVFAGYRPHLDIL